MAILSSSTEYAFTIASFSGLACQMLGLCTRPIGRILIHKMKMFVGARGMFPAVYTTGRSRRCTYGRAVP
jgi:hypothetical protein